MNVQTIVEEWLKEHKFEGLCNCDVPCGCLLSDIAPCGQPFGDCQPGYRKEVGSSEHCGCDGQGEEHWHITIKKPSVNECVKPIYHDNFYEEAKKWVCECDAVCDPCSSDWRWNGMEWEHYHGYPMGHVVTKRSNKE